MVESWNMVSARATLRTHIDTALRFSAAWLVDNPHDFATAVINGERIDKMKDRDGQRLTDARLVEVHSEERRWLPSVYKELSGYVHFSGSHVSASVNSMGDGADNHISFLISEADHNFPESSWAEIVECFREATEMLAQRLEGYALAKRLTPAQLDKGREFLMKSPPAA